MTNNGSSNQIGLRGASNTDFNNRSQASGNLTSGSTSAGGSNAALVSLNAATYINGNITWTYTPTIATPTITPAGQQNICIGGPGVTLTGNSILPVSPTTWQWKLGGSNVGTNSSTFLANPGSAGNYFYSISVTNATGCTRTSSAEAVVAASCGTAPSFTTCPGNQTANTASLCSAVKTYSTAATGNPVPTITYAFTGATTVSGSGDGSGSTFNVGTTTVTVTATNGIGSPATCSFNVVVTDVTVPTITCSGTFNTCTTTPTLPTPTTSDNCGVASVTNDAPGTFALGSTIVNWTVTDVHGNTNTCAQNVIVGAAPVMTACPGNFNLNNIVNTCGRFVTYNTPATGSPTLSHVFTGVTTGSGTGNGTGTTFNIGVTNVAVTATNSCGSANCNFTITITDNQLPTISCPADITVCSGTTINLGIPTTSDNCGVASVTNNAPGSFPIGTTNVTWTVTDVNNNVNICVQHVTVNPVPVGSASNVVICNGSSSNIALNSTVSNTAFVWSTALLSGLVIGNNPCSSNCGTTISDILTTLSSAQGVVQYTVTPSYNGCTGTDFNVTATINSPSTAPSSLNGGTLICGGSGSTTLTQSGGSLGTGAYWQWYTDANYTVPVGGQLSSANAALSVSPVTTTTYYLRAEGAANPCSGTANGPAGGITVNTTTTGTWIGSTSTNWFDASNWCGGVPTAGTNVVIPAGATNMPLIGASGAVCNYITINSGATLSMNSTGDLTVSGYWTNNGTFIPGMGSVTFGGSVLQYINSATSFDNLYLNNPGHLILNANILVSTLLEMDNGNIITGIHTVTLDTNAVGIANGGFVHGNVRAYIAAGNGVSVTYPIGTFTNYTPLDLFMDSVSTGGYITARSNSGDHPNIATSGFITNETVNRYWTLSNNGVVFDMFSIGLQYQPSDVDANMTEAYAEVKEYTGGNWISLSGVNSFGYEFVDGITTFGDYQIGQENPVPSLYTLTPAQGAQGQTLNVEFDGAGYIAGVSSINVGAGITVNSTTVNADTVITANISIAANATLGIRPFTVSNSGPGGGTSTSIDFTVGTALPTADFLSNTVIIPCNTTGTAQFDNNSTNATSYSWNFGSGANPPTANGFGPYTVSYTTTGLKTVTLIATNSSGSDTLTQTNYINVTAVAPAVPPSITGPLGVCALIGTDIVYNCPLVNGAVNYNWTVPSGATLVSGQLSNVIHVVFNNGFTTGNITVNASNGCGTSANRVIAISAPPPATPGPISGPTVVCGVTSTIYSVPAVPGASSYTWTVPTGVTGMTINSGQGTNAIQVTISSGTVIGEVKVQATGSCGTSGIDSIAITKKPQIPGAIAGPTSVCGQTTATYSVAPVFGATSYGWTLPAGMTAVGNATGTSINVSIAGTFVSGLVKVSAINACGNIPGTSITVYGNVPQTPVSLSGPTAVCGLSTATYTTPAVSGATGYLWTATGGATISGANTGLSVTVNFSGTAGTIAVQATNPCGAGTARTLNLSVAAAQPGAITGPANVCGMLTATYSVASVGNGYTYNWVVPSGMGTTTFTGQGTTSITVSCPQGSTSTAGTLKVSSSNTCNSTSAIRSMTVTRCLNAVAMSGDENSFSDIYPNPATTEFTLSIDNEKWTIENGQLVLEIYSVLGEKMQSAIIINNQSTINISQLSNGIYFVRLINGDGNVFYTQRMLKQ